MLTCKDIKGPALDLIIHSPGGSPEATASLVRYLRTKFSDIRIFVPVAAMSAATMLALAGNVIVMGKHSQLGPIDPQMVLPLGLVPARAILNQFEQAKRECRDPGLLAAWIPILQQYGPALIQQCEAAERLAQELAREWLRKYMFAGEQGSSRKAGSIAKYFADFDRHHSHSLGIDREQARARGVKVVDLEKDQRLQDMVLSVHHATIHTFQGLAVKIIENHLGKAFVRLVPGFTVRLQGPAIELPAPTIPPAVAPDGSQSGDGGVASGG